jgi:GTPase SAR1 family protein
MGSGNVKAARAEKEKSNMEKLRVIEEELKVARVKRNATIDLEILSFIRLEKEKNAKKLLFLGAGGSGKSTILKQMKVIYGDQYSDTERKQYTSIIFSNILTAIQTLILQVEKWKFLVDEGYLKHFELIKNTPINAQHAIDIKVGSIIKLLWNCEVIKTVWSRRNEFQITESVEYYFDKIDIIKMPDYIPDKDDILHSRTRTVGIVTEQYYVDGSLFLMYDVGGQRNERRKWIHLFEGVSAIIYVASISEYDQYLYEDSSVNRMVEAINVFETICKNSLFNKCSFILFLNMKDLFKVKIKIKSIKAIKCFSDYEGTYIYIYIYICMYEYIYICIYIYIYMNV